MEATDGERREVAARLRKCGAELSILGADCETAFHVIDKVVGCREVDSWDGFLGRLADLIEPEERTCTWKKAESGSYMTSCGSEFFRMVSSTRPASAGSTARAADGR